VRDTLRRGGETVPNSVGGRFEVVTIAAEVGYQLPRGFDVRARAPLHWKSFEETMPAVTADASGLGDVELLGRYERTLAPHWRVSVHARERDAVHRGRAVRGAPRVPHAAAVLIAAAELRRRYV
jgi:hypothetical protein